jgi:hypothetical protein
MWPADEGDDWSTWHFKLEIYPGQCGTSTSLGHPKAGITTEACPGVEKLGIIAQKAS